MLKYSISAIAVAAMFVAAAPIASAETGSTAAANVTANEVMPGQMRVSKLDGAALFDQQNQKIGTVENVILDTSGRVAGVAVKLNGNVRNANNANNNNNNGNGGVFSGGNGSNLVELDLKNLKATTVNGEPQFMVNMTDQQLASAPAFNQDRLNGNRGAAGSNVQTTAAAPGQGAQILAKNLNGATVYDRENKKVGSIKDIILNPSSDKVADVVISTNGRNVAVPMQDLHVALNNNDSNDIQRVTIDRTESQLQSAPVFQLNPRNG